MVKFSQLVVTNLSLVKRMAQIEFQNVTKNRIWLPGEMAWNNPLFIVNTYSRRAIPSAKI